MICPSLGRCNDALFSFFFSSTSFFVCIIIPLFRSSSLSIYLSIYLLPYFLLFLFQAIYLYLFSLSLDLPLPYLPIYPRTLSQCIIVTTMLGLRTHTYFLLLVLLLFSPSIYVCTYMLNIVENMRVYMTCYVASYD